MDRAVGKEKSSRKHRDRIDREREKERNSTSEHRDHDHKHRSSKEKFRDADDDDHRQRSKYRESDDRHRRSRDDADNDRRRSSREYPVGSERSHEPRNEREGSIDRSRYRDKHEKSYEREVKRERSYEFKEGREESVERRHSSSYSHKRKERGESEDRYDGSEKKARVLAERKQSRRFEDRVENDKDVNGGEKEEKIEKRKFENGEKNSEAKGEKWDRKRFEDKVKEEDVEVNDEGKRGFLDGNMVKKEPKEEPVDTDQSGMVVNVGGSFANGAALESLNMASRTQPETSLAPIHPPPAKVYSISTPNENKGVNINRSHEVPGKSSTDGTASDAGKSGGLSRNALEKAKSVLQKQKEVLEKLKKLPLGAGSSRDGSPRVGSKNGVNASSSSAGILPTPVPAVSVAVSAPSGATPGVTTSSAAVASVNPPASDIPHLTALTARKYEAVKRAQELAAKMGFRQDPEFAPLINMFPGQMPPDVPIQPKPAKAPVLRLDALGREIDEHGNVVNMPKLNNLSTLKVNINKQKKEAFQILKPDLDIDPEKNLHFDARMGINKNKLLRPKRMTFQFVEEGKWSKDAEIIKLKSQFGEAKAKELKAKQAQLAKAKAEPDINPNLIEVSERVITKEKPKEPIPDIEWWDVHLLHSGTYDEIIIDVNIDDNKLKMEKITIYVEHPRPIEPPAEPAPPPPQPLKLTKKEQKKLRTQRRLAREKDRQEMIRQGLLEPPKPKVKMSNLMKVLGSEATQDPTKLEMEIRSAAAEREQAHVDRNIARKLTPSERREKKERKLFDDPNTLETIVSVYKINDLSHPQTRFKVDVNAQENRLTGCAVILDGISVVVVEGGNKSIKRYSKLMLRRINWAAAVKDEEEREDEDEDKPPNKCVLVWQGSVAKPSFNRFFVHECRTEAAARKVLADAGVGHYWDLAVNFADDEL